MAPEVGPATNQRKEVRKLSTKLWPIVAAAITAVAVITGTLFFLGLSAPQNGNGELAVEMQGSSTSPTVDANATANVSAVWVTYTSVSVHESNGSGGGWATINSTGGTMNLWALKGPIIAEQIGLQSLPAGHYEQVRIALSNVSVTLANGTNLTAFVPAASTADFDGAFNITSGMTTTISVEIDLGSCLHIESTPLGLRAVFTPNIGSVVVVSAA